jgi:hypothetical protein
MFVGVGELKAALASYKSTKSFLLIKDVISKGAKKAKKIISSLKKQNTPEPQKALTAPAKPKALSATPQNKASIINSDGSITTHYTQNKKVLKNKFTTYGKKIKGIRYKKFKDELTSIKTETKYINQMFKSGSTLPRIVKVTRGMELYKIAPKYGKKPSKYSPYWMTKEELIKVFNSDKGIENLLALPEESCTGTYNIYKITLKDGVNLEDIIIFENKIAPSKQGIIKRKGGAQQILVPDRDAWTSAIKITEFKIE